MSNNIKVFTIKPSDYTGLRTISSILAVTIAQIEAENMTVLDIRAGANGTIEILSQKICEYDLRAMPSIVLAAPKQKDTTPRLDISQKLRHYNRIQNTKYNAALRNYKGRKR